MEPIIRDPIYKLFIIRLRWRPWQFILFVFLISAILFFGVGGVASWRYQGQGERITSLSNMGFILAWLFAFLPLLWGSYLWQLGTIRTLFSNLKQRGVLGAGVSQALENAKKAYVKITLAIGSFWIYLIGISLVICFWLIEISVNWPDQWRIREQFWHQVSWYFPIHIIAWTIGLYPLFIFAIRQLVIVLELASFFNQTDLQIQIQDPDTVGGLGAMKSFIKSSIWIAIGLGFIAALFTLEVYLSGARIITRFDLLGIFTLYLLLVPVCLGYPYYYVSNAMRRSLNKELEPITCVFQEVVQNAQTVICEQTTSAKDIKEMNDRLAELIRYQQFIIGHYPVSPLTVNALRSFSITAAIPAISGIISFVLQVFKIP